MSEVSTRGVGYTKHLDETLRRGVYESPIPNWNFLYETPSTTKNVNYNVGDRVCLPDGRVFRYGRATNVVNNTMQGLKFFGQETDDGIGYKAPAQAQVVGDSSIIVAESGVTLDELRGGMSIFHTHGEYADFTRGIVGNTATDSDGNVTIYFDAEFHIAITTSFGVETCPNPYRFLSYRTAVNSGPGGDAYSSVAGIPTRKTTAANQYVWIQTWGPCWINPQGSIGYTVIASRRTMWFTDEGSIICVNSAGDDTAMRQIAGFLLSAEDASGTGPPLMMLTITP